MSIQEEKNIEVAELLEEIRLILGDYMVANYEKTDDGFLIIFPNGQKFEFSVSKIN